MMPQRNSSPHMAWAGLCSLLALMCAGVWLLPVEWQIALRWRSDTWVQQPWTLWTASLAHLSDTHLLVNMLALMCLAIIGWHAGCQRDDVMAVLIAWPVSTLALLLWPQVQFYAGFSGLNHALALIIIARSAIYLIVNKEFSVIVFLLTVMLTAKIIWEAAWVSPLRPDASWGFNVVQAVHLTGLVAAALAVALVQATVYLAARILLTRAVVENPSTNGSARALPP